jgi:hypothetical protein
VYRGVVKATYKHHDSYPAGLGEQALAYVRGHDLATLRAHCDGIRLVSEKDPPTPEDVERTRSVHDLSVANRATTDWYCLLRDAQGDLNAYARLGVMIDNAKFLRDSLFCEWAYLVNLDDGTLDVYRGFQHVPPKRGLFAGENAPEGEKYYPCELQWQFKLDDLPRSLAEACREGDEP